jgi:DNA-directed RNA polymerase subunit D
MIKVKNYEKKGNVVEFDVAGADVRLLNAFRRTITVGVPVMAIEKVTFYTNSSILNDENLVHRIGLTPLTTDLKTYVTQDECACKGKGCGRCMCVLTMDVTGPKTVYSGDFKTTDENIKPVYDKIPLVKLMAKQKIKLEAEAILGYGSEHTKWQPGLASYELKDKNEYHVIVESYGPLPVEDLITKAFEVVDGKIQQLKDKVS